MRILPTFLEFRTQLTAVTDVPEEVAWIYYEQEIEARITAMTEDDCISREHLHDLLAHDTIMSHMGETWYHANIKTAGPAPGDTFTAWTQRDAISSCPGTAPKSSVADFINCSRTCGSRPS